MLLLLLLLLLPAGAAAQGWVVDASAGAAEYEAVAGEVGSLNAILGIRREGTLWAVAQGGVPFDSGGVPWLSGGAGGRWTRPAGPVQLGVDLGGIGYGYRVSELDATGGGGTLIALPFVAFTRGSASLELRSGILHHTALFESETESRTVHDNGMVALWVADPQTVIEAEGRLVRDGDASYPFAALRADYSVGRGAVWGRVGRWFAEDLDQTGWGVGASYTLPRRIEIRAEYQRQTDDPLYWNGPRTGWTIGLSRAFGPQAGSAIALPAPEGLRQSAGEIVIRLPSSEAQEAPSIAGDFTDWQPVRMVRQGGEWRASFTLPAGIYRYSFVRADGSWFVPDSVPNQVDDGFGGSNAVLVVGP